MGFGESFVESKTMKLIEKKNAMGHKKIGSFRLSSGAWRRVFRHPHAQRVE